MPTCNSCSMTFDSAQAGGSPGVCPFCGAQQAPDTGWTSVARVVSLAEAGFLANDLDEQGIQTRVVQTESFSALTGAWDVAYVIQAHDDEAATAAARIREHTDQETADQAWEPEHDVFVADERPVDMVIWRPLALMVFAGMAAFWLGQRFAEQGGKQPQIDVPQSLSSAVAEIGRPFATEPLPGKPRYRLTFDRHSQSWNLDADGDGDGQFERHRRFPSVGSRP